MDKEMAIETLQEMKGVFGGRGHEQYALLALDLAIDALEKQAPIYDVEKVVRQLKKNKINCNNSNAIFNTDDFVKLSKAIKIVRSGGNDEEQLEAPWL